MKNFNLNLNERMQLFLEHLLIIFLIAIIAVGVYKLVKKWTEPEQAAPKPQVKAHSIIDVPSKELCSFMMKQCQKRPEHQE